MTIFLMLATLGLVIYSSFFNRRWAVPVDILMVLIYLNRVAREAYRGNTVGVIWGTLCIAFWAYWVDRDLKEGRRGVRR